MKACGIKRITGVSAKGPYDFAELMCGSVVELGKFGAATIEGGGVEVVGMEVAPDAVAQFAGLFVTPFEFIEVNIKTESRNVRGEWKTVCIGVEKAATVAALRKAS